jgi:uncharacterized protein YbjT (DUF2867 family)
MYVVAGATGNTGGAVARTLAARRVPLRVIVRARAKGERWAARGADVAVADLRDAAALAKAFAGATAAYVLNPPAYTMDDLFAQAEAIADAVGQAARSAGLRRLVALSSVGAHLSSGHGNIRTNTIFDARLASVDGAITFVRPAYFMQNWAAVARAAAQDGVLPSFLAPLDRAIPMVSTADVGRVAAEAMLDGATGRCVIELAGPRPYAPTDAAAAFTKALGRPVTAIAVPEAQWPAALAQAHFSPRTIESWVELFRGFNSGLIGFEGKGVRLVGRVPLERAIADLLSAERAPSLGVQA